MGRAYDDQIGGTGMQRQKVRRIAHKAPPGHPVFVIIGTPEFPLQSPQPLFDLFYPVAPGIGGDNSGITGRNNNTRLGRSEGNQIGFKASRDLPRE